MPHRYPLPDFPVVELHRHLDGNVRLDTVLDLARRHRIELPASTREELRPHVQVLDPTPDLLGFLAKFDVLRRVMVDLDAVARIARENVEDAAAEGIDHIELRFSPAFMAEEHGLDPQAVAETVCAAVAEACGRLPVSARLICIVSRTYGPDAGWVEVEAALACRRLGVGAGGGAAHGGIVALDLAGDEAGFPGELFVEHFRRAREGGLRTIAHAGEAAGAESVRQALDGLGAERIGHGVRAVEDPALLDRLAETRIPLEVCPTSNVQTSTVAGYRAHPLGRLLAHGIAATLNTDDPSISGIDLPHEYRVAREEMGLGDDELAALQRNAFDAAFLDEGERAELLARAARRGVPPAAQPS
jgi:adenosine deaminase